MSQKTAVVLLLDFCSTWNSIEKNRTDCCRSWYRAIQRGRQWCRDTHWPIIANSRVPRGSDWLARTGPCGLRGWEPSCNCTGSANHCQMPTGHTTPNRSYFSISIRGFMENNKRKMVKGTSLIHLWRYCTLQRRQPWVTHWKVIQYMKSNRT